MTKPPTARNDNWIFYIQYTNPAAYPPLLNSARIFSAEGMKVFFLGCVSKETELLCASPTPNIFFKLISFPSGRFLKKLFYIQFCLLALSQAVLLRPRWVYASDIWSCFPAFVLKYFFRFKVIYHEHDSPVLESEKNRSVYFKISIWFRKALAKRAELCILPNQARIALFTQQTGRTERIVCVWNCPSKSEVALTSHPINNDAMQVVYSGVLGPSRLPLALVQALQMLPESVSLCVIGYETIGSIGFGDALRQEGEKCGLSKRLQILNAMPRHILMGYLQKADVGFAALQPNVMDSNIVNMVGASNKPFDYLSCGLPILISNEFDWEKTYVKHQLALGCDPTNPKSIAEALNWFLSHSEERREMGERGRQMILNEWNYEKQFFPVAEYVKHRLN